MRANLLFRKLVQSILAFLMFVCLFVGAASPVAAQSVPPGPASPTELGFFLDGVMAASMAANHVPGGVISVVKDGQVYFAKGYGYADLENQIPVDPATTLFRPGSVSKLFTWTAVMQLVEQGKLDLDEDVNTYLDFEIPTTYTQPITLKHLLTHTPGFEDKGDGLFKLKAEDLIPLESYLKENLPARVFPPGEIAAYSNYGTALAGYIIERVSGIPYLDYIEENILTPLGMEHSTFRQPLPTPLAGNMANGYGYANGQYYQGGFEFVTGYPAGGLSASALDMAKFMTAHLQNGRYGEAQILQIETARLMRSRLYSADPRMDGMAYGFFQNKIGELETVSHGGDTMLFHSELFLLPDQNFGIFISTNGSSGAKVVESVLYAILERYYPADRPELVPTADFAERSDKYAGSYYLARSNFTTLEKIISLMNPITVQVDDQAVLINLQGETMRYVEVEPGLLVNVERPWDKAFLKEEAGQIYLHPTMPFTFIKTPWQRSILLHGLIFLGGTLLFLFTLIGWMLSFVVGLLRRDRRPVETRLARVTAGMFGLIFLAFLASFGSAFLDINPAYGVPNIFFGVPAGFDGLLQLPFLLAGLGALMLIFSALAWGKQWWNASARLHYTLVTIFAGAILWALYFWNLWL